MSGLLVYAGKRAIIDALSDLIPEDTAQVAYSFPGNPDRTLVYGGGARFTRAPVTAESSSPAAETAVIDIWLRVEEPGGDVREAEQMVETLAVTVIGALYTHRLVGTGFTFVDVSTGVAPTSVVSATPTPTIVARLQLQVTVRGIL